MATRQDSLYYAVADPHDTTLMTYWREDRGHRHFWPSRSHYGPRLRRADIPDGLNHDEFDTFYWDWLEEHQIPWWTAAQAVIDADPLLAQARFADLTTRCCRCGRKLVSPNSKLEAIGPDCRTGLPEAVLEQLRDNVRRLHAALEPSTSERLA